MIPQIAINVEKYMLDHISELRNRLNFKTKLLKIKKKEEY